MSKKMLRSAASRADEARILVTARRNAVSMAVTAALTGALAMPAVTVAQEVSDEVIEEVVTTGFRSSLRNAMMMKQNSESIVEAITAEDIGKLPDASIAESLARLPGLTVTNGRIRGDLEQRSTAAGWSIPERPTKQRRPGQGYPPAP